MINKKMSKRLNMSYESRMSGSGAKVNYMNYGDIGRDVEYFTPNAGKNRINILPYRIATKNHPLVANKKGYEIGDVDYNLDLFVHRGIGASQSNVVCPNKTFGKPCPICEARNAMLNDKSKAVEAESLKPKRRVIYNVEDLNDEGKVKIFDVSHFLFEKELIEEAKDESDGVDIFDFSDLDEGKEIKFRANEVQKSSKIKYFEFKSFGFDEREEPLSDKLVKQIINLDECLTVHSYDELKEIFEGGSLADEPSDKDDEEEEKPSRSSRKSRIDDDDEDEDFEEKTSKRKLDDDEEDEPVRPSKKRRHYDDEDEAIF